MANALAAAVETKGMAVDRVESALNVVAPAALHACLLDIHAAHDQPVPGAGQGHVEQAQGLFLAGLLAGFARPARGRAIVGFARRPEEAFVLGIQQRAALRRGARGGVRQDHDRRLQALGAVDGHHSHLAARSALDILLLALHFDLVVRHPGDESLQVAYIAALGRQRFGQEGVHGVLGFGAQAR